MKTKIYLIILALSIPLTSCMKKIGENATENLIPATKNIEDASKNIEDASENIVKVSDNLNEAISNLEEVVSQLGDTGDQLIGSAGDAMKDIIEEFSYSANSVISQVENSSINVIEQSEKSTIRVLDALTQSGTSLLKETKDLITGTVSCIDEAMAKRIAQITDNAFHLADRLDVLINETIITISNETHDIIEFGGQQFALTVTKSTFNFVSIILLLASVILIILPLLYFLFKAKDKPAKYKYVTGGLFVLPAILCFALWTQPAFLWVKLGHAIIAPEIDYNSYCERSNNEFAGFLSSYEASTAANSYRLLGLNTINTLNKCSYGNPDREQQRIKRKMVAEIETILFPPPLPKAIDYASCEQQDTGRKTYHPGIWSDRRNAKAKLLEQMIQSNKIKRVPFQANPNARRLDLSNTPQAFNAASYIRSASAEIPSSSRIRMASNVRTLNLSINP